MKNSLFFLIIASLMIAAIILFTFNSDLKAAQENRLQNNLKKVEKQNSTEAEKGIADKRDTVKCECGLTLAPLKILAPTKEVMESMKSWQRDILKFDESGKSLDEMFDFLYLYRGKTGDIDKSLKLKAAEKRMLKDKALKAERCFKEIRRICRNDKDFINAKRLNARKDPDGWCKVNCKRLKQLHELMKNENINELQYSSSGSSVIGDFSMEQANGTVLIYPDEINGEFVEIPGYVGDVSEYYIYYRPGRNVKLSSDVVINSNSIAFLVCNKKLKKGDTLNNTEIISMDFLCSKEEANKLSDESLLGNFVYYGNGFKPEWGYKMEIVNDPSSYPRN